MRALFLLAIAAAAWLAAAGAAGGAVCDPGDPFQLLDLHLEMDPADWEAVRRDARFEDERPALFRCGDEDPLPVRVRRKVSYALPSDGDPRKVSLKIDFDDLVPEGEWHGQRKIGLENGLFDPVLPCALIKEGVAWIIMARSGAITGGSSWARLSVNGEPAGVFTRIEHVDRSWLRRHLGEDEHFLYKLDRRSPTGDVRRRLTREGEVDPWAKDLCWPPFDGGCCGCPVPAEGLPAVIEDLDVHQLLAMAAVNTLLANTDGYLEADNNHYWYNSERPRLYFPWDLDLGLMAHNVRHPPHASEAERLLFVAAPELRGRFDRILRRLLDGPFSPAALEELMDRVEAALGPALAEDPLHGLEGGFAAEARRVRAWLAERSRFLAASVTHLPSEPLVINEVLAANVHGARDEAGEADDWVEILNRGPRDVLLDSHYLSDDPAWPAKWRLPEITIPAGGRILVWCDGDVAQGPLHARFSLDRDGEAIGLYEDRDGILQAVDFIRFARQEPDAPLGRIPDGSPIVRALPCATPGLENQAPCPPARFIRGDASPDGALDLSDAVAVLGGLFLGAPIPCARAGDADDDGRIDITDPVRILLHLFQGGSPPPPPHPACGTDPTEDGLDCLQAPACEARISGE